jgi:alanine dehydrogenase
VKVGIPREIKTEEQRVSIVPAGVSAFVSHGHEVFVEREAGTGSGISDEEYRMAGAKIVDRADLLWRESDMIMKVKEPLNPEFDWMREGQIIFTFFHLAADEDLTRRLLERKIIGIAYETIQLEDGSLPLLAPMSEVAGRLAIQMGAFCLEAKNGGSGILLSGVSGVPPARVAIIGGGIAGTNACHIAVGIGAQVSILDVNAARLRYLQDLYHGRVMTVMSNRANIAEFVESADLVIGSVLIPGARAPRLITRGMIQSMKKGSAFVDISIDQGGCAETSKPTTHDNPIYVVDDVVHYCVANMPGAVPRTSTYALTNVTISYALEIADKGYEQALKDNRVLARGLNLHKGRVTYKHVAEAFNMEYQDICF